MAGELRHRHPTTGATIYAHLVRVSDGAIYNGSTFETPAAANWGTYDIACAEQSTTQYYYGDMPAVAAGLYDVFYFLQSGGSPATTDTLVGKGSIDWSGSAETTVTSRLAGASYTAPLDAAGVRTAVGLASANLDTQLAAIAGYIDTEVSSLASSVAALPTTAQIADKILGRNIGGGSDGGRTVTQAMRALRNRFTRTADTYTVYAEDDSTVSWTSVLTTNDALDPVSESNP